MKAISLASPSKVEIVEIPEPVVGAEDVLIELRYIGLCGSDLNAYRGLSPMVTYPRVLGHEVGGVIVAKGEQVPARIQKGAYVTVSPYSNCGLCPACRIGRVNTCQFNQTMGVQRDGALTERISIHYNKIYASNSLTLQELALVEPLSVGYHATNRGRVSETDTVLVLGCGTVGLGVIAAAARKGATVIAVDIDDAKLNQAASLGAQHTINSATADVKSRVEALTSGEGVSVAIEAVGLPSTSQMAIELVAVAGRVVFIGWAKEEIAFQTRLIISKELEVLGSRNALHVLPSVIKMLEGRQRPFTDIISNIVPFAEAPQIIAAWAAAPQRFKKILIEMPTTNKVPTRT